MAENDPMKARAFKQRTDVRDDSDEDPLVELARIVGEENNYYGARSEKAGPVRDEASERGALSGDLESELLNELESSLAPRNPFAAPTARAVAPAPRVPIRPLPAQPAAPADTDDGDELMRSIEEQLSAFERRNQSARAAPSAAPAQPQWNSRSEQLRGRQASTREDADDEEQSGAPELMPRGQQRGVLRAAAAPDPGLIPGGSRAEQSMGRGNPVRSGVQPAGVDGGAIRGRPGHDGNGRNLAATQQQVPLRPDRAAQPSFAPSATAGWNEIAGTDDSFDEPRAVPREAQQTRSSATGLRGTIGATADAAASPAAATRSAQIEAELARELESGYSDASSASTWPEPSVHYADEEPRVAAAAGDSDGGTTAVGSRRRQRSRKGLLVLASLLAVAVVGGGVAAYMRTADQVASGPPPVIAPPEGAVKVDAPAQQQEAAQETVGQAVYNRVAGAAAPTEEQVVDGAEEPEEISRIVLPPPEPAPPPPDAAAADPQAPGADAGAAVEPTAGPRRVRTYLVRPDGTIVASEEAPAGAAAPEQPTPAEGEQQVAALSEERPAEPVTVPTAQINEPLEVPAAEAAPGDAPAEPNTAPAEPPAQSETQAAIADLAPTQSPDTPAVPPAAEATPPGAVPTDVASAPSGEAAAPPAAADGHFVQLSSQRSMEQAQSSFAGMKQQFASVLGPLSADIQEADLGAKGTYYRVRVGPYATRGEAITVCEQLKAAGGSCIVTK
jgi:cell division protein FtsN